MASSLAQGLVVRIIILQGIQAESQVVEGLLRLEVALVLQHVWVNVKVRAELGDEADGIVYSLIGRLCLLLLLLLQWLAILLAELGVGSSNLKSHFFLRSRRISMFSCVNVEQRMILGELGDTSDAFGALIVLGDFVFAYVVFAYVVVKVFEDVALTAVALAYL